MMGGANPSPAWRIYADTDFDADAFIGEAEKLFSNLCTGENRIRSGNYIPKGCKSVISSYRLLARHTAEDGEGRVDVIHIKLAPGVTCSEAEEKTVDFLTKYMRDSGSGGVFAAITAARGQGWISMFLESPSLCGIFIPDDILDFIASQGIKNYLHKSCGVSFDTLDDLINGSLGPSQEKMISEHAEKMDNALASMFFCDIAASGGKIICSVCSKIAEIRLRLGRFLSDPKPRTAERFTSEFIESLLYAVDLCSVSIDVVKAELRLKFPDADIKETNFVTGSVLSEKLFDGKLFDLIISNPPHIRGEEISSIRNRLSDYLSSHRNADLYCYYAERAPKLLSRNGCAVLLISNKWMTAEYGEGLREFFKDSPPDMIVDLGRPEFLKGTVMPMSIISLFREPESNDIKFIDASERSEDVTLSEYCTAAARPVTLQALTPLAINSSCDDASALVQKIISRSTPLSECVESRIYRGLLTGLNEAFVIPKETGDKIAAQEPESKQILVPFYTGRMIKRYYMPPATKFLIFMPKGYTQAKDGGNDTDALLWFAKKHPLIAEHLAKFEKRAAKRRDKGFYWWELRPCNYYEVFKRPKIVMPLICKRVSAVSDENGSYVNDKCCMIDTDDTFILALLNSRLLDFIFRAITPALLNDYRELRPSVLAKLPIAGMNPQRASQKKIRDEIADLGKKLSEMYKASPPSKHGIADAAIRDAERETDRLVYKLYKLTPAEINIVENN